MKNRSLILSALAAVLFIAAPSCKKDNSLKPSLDWPANSSFKKTMDITNPMDAEIEFNVPEGLSSFTLTWTGYPSFLQAVINEKVGVQKNKGVGAGPIVYAPIEDTGVASYFSSIGITGIRPGTTKFVFSFSKLLTDFISKHPESMSSGDLFVFTIAITDVAGNSVSNSVSFRYVGVPVLYFDPEIVELNNSTDCILSITAPGKIAGATLTVDTTCRDIHTWFSKRCSTYTTLTPVIDLIEDKDAVEYLSAYLPVGNAIQGQSKAFTVSLSSLLKEFKLEMGNDISYAGNHLTFTVTDELGWSGSATMTFSKTL